jgi:integrase
MASVYARGKKLWFRLKVEGKWRSRPTPYRVGEEAAAERYAAAAQRAVEKREAKATTDGPLTLAAYAEQWLKQRKELGVRSWENESARLRLHVLPTIGHLPLTDVRAIHVRDLVRALTTMGKLAPRTIRDVYGVLHCLYETAIGDELLEHNPCKLRQSRGRGRELPRKIDADPEWRSQATYAVREVEQLISDPRIPPARRVLHALKAIGGLRHEEAAALRWRHYDPSPEPLGRLAIARAYDSRACEEKATKSGAPRRMPVHPVLAKLLAAWKLSHWERIYGHPPGPDDLIVPTLTGRHVNVSDAGHDLTDDLTQLGLRVMAGARRKRGGHDLRSWFITTCQEHGAHRDLLRVCTHGAGTDVLDGYTRATWTALCAEVSKLRVSLLDGEVLELATVFATAERRASNRWRKRVSPEGLEPSTLGLKGRCSTTELWALRRAAIWMI